MDLQPGQNCSLSRHSPAPAAITVALAWEPATTALTLDANAFALTAAGTVRGDADFIFYNQPTLPGGGIQRDGDGRSFTITFAALPAGIITAGFLEEFRLTRIRSTHRCPSCGEHLELEDHKHE